MVGAHGIGPWTSFLHKLPEGGVCKTSINLKNALDLCVRRQSRILVLRSYIEAQAEMPNEDFVRAQGV